MPVALEYAGWFFAMVLTMSLAYDIRLYAIRTFGFVIHEFDPWFNYRATEYMVANGWDKFQVSKARSRRDARATRAQAASPLPTRLFIHQLSCAVARDDNFESRSS